MMREMNKKKTSKASKKKFDNLSKTLLQYISGKQYHPLKQADLFKKIDLPKELHPIGRDVITQFIKDEVITLKKGKIYGPQVEKQVVEGTISMHPRGFGFVSVENEEKDIFIPRHLTAGAVQGDVVSVEINPKSRSEKGPEGRILEITKRSRTTLSGTIQRLEDDGFFLIYCPLLGEKREVLLDPPKGKRLKEGDRVILEIDEWGDDTEPTYTIFSKKLGHISDASIDNKAACNEFEIRTKFPKKVLEDAKKYGSTVTRKDSADRTDFTDMETITIDPTTAKDFDDALSIKKGRSGRYHLAVHIADVSHYVKEGSPLDEEAKLRANSTYLPGECIPMLPENLSNGLCSLRQGVKRLTVSVLMLLDKDGTLLDYEIKRGIIKSAKRFTYEEAKQVLDGKKKSKFSPSLKLMVSLCTLLKQKRFERGGIDLALPELSLKIGKDGMPTGYEIVEYDITHQLVEEFMLKANEIVAKHLTDEEKATIFRIHEAPTSADFETFYTLARVLGFPMPAKPSHEDIQKLFSLAKGTPHAYPLSVAFVRSMRLAYYSPENVGHYGLALEHYCHFTSPIRRYSDLMVHRQLFQKKQIENLEQEATICSEKERASFRAESSTLKLKKLRLLKEQDPETIYEGTVSKLKPFGLYFELHPFMLEGFIHISKLGSDFYEYDSKSERLVGRTSGKTFSSGQKITIKLIFVDLIIGECRWVLEGGAEMSAPRKRRKRKKR